MQIKNLTSPHLHIESLKIQSREAWCFIGSNRSGIDRFVQLLTGTLPDLQSEELSLSQTPALVSFASQQQVFEEELRKDDTDFLNRADPGTSARHFLQGDKDISHLLPLLGMSDLLDQGYRQLSTGESRKLMFLQALAQSRDVLIIQNPYDGLDQKSCKELDQAILSLLPHGIQILITVNNRCDIPSWCTHLGFFENGHLMYQGRKQRVLEKILPNQTKSTSDLTFAFEKHPDFDQEKRMQQELVSLKDGFANFGERTIFCKLDLRVMEGQHTLVTGSNGSGKSTLLQILTGDNQQCYSNKLRIFGKNRGTGESIWDIKQQMGIVSSELHRNYYIPGKVLHVVISGLFDSIGVYKHYKKHHADKARWWLSLIGLQHKANITFKKLSYADQRLVLIARALIKMPRLLVLDEPTQGLDERNREQLLSFLEIVTKKHTSTLIYASHRKDEFRSFFRQHILLEKYAYR